MEFLQITPKYYQRPYFGTMSCESQNSTTLLVLYDYDIVGYEIEILYDFKSEKISLCIPLGC